MTELKRYTEADEVSLFTLLKNEGVEWSDYWEKRPHEYAAALLNSITYVLYDNEVLCGYCRCREDDGFGVYVYDLLVDKNYRGKQLGRALLDKVYSDYPEEDVFVMSDVDEYYEKQGYTREGSIFMIASQDRSHPVEHM